MFELLPETYPHWAFYTASGIGLLFIITFVATLLNYIGDVRKLNADLTTAENAIHNCSERIRHFASENKRLIENCDHMFLVKPGSGGRYRYYLFGRTEPEGINGKAEAMQTGTCKKPEECVARIKANFGNPRKLVVLDRKG